MFPEYRDLISRLKTEDNRFARLFEEHNDIDHKIVRMEQNAAAAINGADEIEALKREKLRLKDELHEILKAEAAAE